LLSRAHPNKHISRKRDFQSWGDRVTATRTPGELLGERVRELRQKHGLTQVDLAERLGVPQSRVSEIESGSRVPNLITMLRLAAALDCKPTALLAPFDKLNVIALLRK
jgi:DNA-binding XRE family transcriptional regulator